MEGWAAETNSSSVGCILHCPLKLNPKLNKKAAGGVGVVASKRGCFRTYKAGRGLVLSQTASFYGVKIKFASILLGGGPS